MKKAKKLLSILLSLALTAAFIPSFSIFPSAEEATSYPIELVKNGSFHTTDISSQWNSQNAETFEAASNENYGGSGYSLKVGHSDWHDTVLTVAAKPNTKYIVSFYGKSYSGQFQYYLNDNSGTTLFTKSSISCDGGWKNVSFAVETGADTAQLKLVFNLNSTAAYIDDVSIMDVTALDKFTLNFDDGTLSDHATLRTDNVTVTLDGAYSGYSLKIAGSSWNSWATFAFPVQPGQCYRVSFYSKAINNAWYQYKVGTDLWGNNQLGGASGACTTDYQKQQFVFTANADQYKAWFYVKSSGDSIYIDDITVEAIASATVDENALERVVDGSFENGLSAQWTDIPSGLSVTNEQHCTGNYSLKYVTVGDKDWDSAAGLTVSVVPGKTYIASFKERAAGWQPQFQYGVGTLCGNYDYTGKIMKNGNEGGSNIWTAYSCSFTVPENVYQVVLTLNFHNNNAAGNTIYFDDISIHEAVNVTVAASSEEAGEVTGAGTYKVGESVTVNAVNNSGYAFDGWYNGENKLSTDPEYTFTAAANVSLEAKFRATSNLIANDSFETGSWNWNSAFVPYKWGGQNWSHIESSTDAHTGKYAVRFKTGGETVGVLRQEISGIEANSAYILSFWVKMTDNQNDALYKINNIEIEKISGDAGEWKQITYSFNTGSNTSIKIEVVSLNSDFVVDDFVLIKSTSKGIVNGDFESGSISGWSHHSETQMTVDSTHANGSYAAKLYDTEWRNATSYTAVVEPGKVYALSFKVYREDDTSNFNFSLTSGISTKLYSMEENALSGDGSVNGWVTVRAAFKSEVDTVKLLINHCGTLWVDDFAMSDITPGDADMNGEINLLDLIRMKKYSLAGEGTSNYLAGDTDNDGKVNATDLSYLRKQLLGIKETATATTTRYEQIMATDGFVYGVNVPWFSYGDQGHNLSGNLLKGYECTYDHDTAYRTLYNCKTTGFNAVNLWLFSGLEGIAFESYTATGLKDDFVANLTDVLEIARDLDIGLTLTIQPHFEGLKDTEYYGIISDSTKQTAYLNNAVKPVLELAADYKEVIVSTVAYCEPDIDVISGGADKEAVKQLTSTIAALSKQYLTDVPVGVAFSMAVSEHGETYSTLIDLQNDDNIDYLGYDYYSDTATSVPTAQWTECDTMLTECAYDTDANTAATVIEKLYTKAKEAGYKGAYYWTYASDSKGLVNQNGDYTEALGAIYRYIRGQRADFAPNEAPVVLYDKNQIVILGNPKAVEYVIEKWNGSNWEECSIVSIDYEESAIYSGMIEAKDNGYYRVGVYYSEDVNADAVYTLIPNTLQ